MSQLKPMISIVIPCYNQGRFLPEAVDSVTTCNFPTQVIVVDDGSTDDSASIADSLPSVTLIRQENRGLAAARNRGLTAALGEFVIFLDADDRLLPGGVDAGANALTAHPDCALAYGRCVMMGPDGAFWPTPEQPVVLADHYGAMLRSNRIWTPAMAIFRREAVENAGGFRRGSESAADYDLYLRIAREQPLHDHGECVAAYRKHASSMSGNLGRIMRDTLAVLRRHRAAAREESQLDAWRAGYAMFQDFYGTQLTEQIRAHVHAHEWGPAIRKALTLAWLAPAVFAREARRKLRTTYAGRAMPAAEISDASVRADAGSGSLCSSAGATAAHTTVCANASVARNSTLKPAVFNNDSRQLGVKPQNQLP
jgi:glycosyltransferase involved in cell wall biosynthesis